MSGQAYVGTMKRTFAAAMLQLLRSQYALLGSDRVLQLLTADVQALIDQFFPPTASLRKGWMLFVGTKAEGGKAYPGQSTSDHHLVTIPWPVCLDQDIAALAKMPAGPAGKQARRDLLKQRLIRLIEHGWNHPDGPVLLTLADLSAMLGPSTEVLSPLLQDARDETGKPLTTMGYYFDLGMKPTHKAEIVALYEQGLDEVEIAQRAQHAQSSVGQYLRDYERVKLALRAHIEPEDIPSITGLQPTAANAYVNMVGDYHPDLLSFTNLPPQGA